MSRASNCVGFRALTACGSYVYLLNNIRNTKTRARCVKIFQRGHASVEYCSIFGNDEGRGGGTNRTIGALSCSGKPGCAR